MVNVNNNPSSAGSNPFQFSSGPAGAISSALFNLITVQTELEKANLDYSKENTQLSSAVGASAAASDIAAGKATANATLCQAWQSGVSAGVTVVGAGVTYGTNAGNTALQDAQQANLSQAENFRAEMSKPSNDDIASARNAKPHDRLVEERIVELKSANFDTSEKIGTFTRSEAVENARKNGDINPTTREPYTVEEIDKLTAEKLRSMPDEAKAVSKKLDRFIDEQSTQVNTLSNVIQRRMQYAQQVEQAVNPIVAAIGANRQSTYQAQQGLAQGGAALAQTTGSMSSSMLGTTNSANNTAAQAIGQILGVLTAISKAYSG